MILGSHNSWSFLPVKRWWMWPIRFVARCQRIDIREQYKQGVRCFDLRMRHKDGQFQIAHGCVVYDYDRMMWMDDMDWLNQKGDCYVRVLHEVRTKRQRDESPKRTFAEFCVFTAWSYPNIRFWCGRNLYDWRKDFDFCDDPTCEERYGSVSEKKWLYGWWPWLYARINNRRIRQQGTEKEVLLIDFADVG